MTAPMLDVQIEELRASRIRCAELVRDLGQRELDGRLLRVEIEQALHKGGMAVTPAEKAAKSDPKYVAFEEESIRLRYTLAVEEARAEARRFEIQLQLTVLQRTEV